MRYSEAAVGNQRFRHCQSPLIGNGVGFRPLDKIVHSDQEVSVSLVARWEGLCYINGYPFERSPDVLLLHLAPILGSGAATGCTGVTLRAPLLIVDSFPEPVVPLSDLIQVLADTQVTSRRSTM
jgi:hypothetical protein